MDSVVTFININFIFIMAKQTASVIRIVKNIARPGVHAKTKSSKLKTSKLYKKAYKGQGK